MKIFKLYVVIIALNSLSTGTKGQQIYNPGGVKNAAYWYAAEQTIRASGFRSKTNYDTSLIPYNSFIQLNYNPSLLFNGSNSLSILLDKRKLSSVTYFTVYKTSDTSNEKIIWHTMKGDKTNLVLTTNRMANLSLIQYMNYTDVTKENPKINIYQQQLNDLNNTPVKHVIQFGSTPLFPKLPVSFFKGSIPEIVIYNRILSSQERLRVSSYLAIKYGVTLTEPDAVYVNSDGEKIWDGFKYSLFHHNIAGICRDDSSGLLQKIAESSNAPGLLTVSSTDSLANNSFLLWGDNGLPLQEEEKITGLPQTLYKRWLFVPSGNTALFNTNLVIDTKQIDASLPVKPVYWLMIDSSGTGNFSSVSTQFIRMSLLDQQAKAHFNNVKWDADKSGKDAMTIIAGQDLLLLSEINSPGCSSPASGSLSIKVIGGKAPYQLTVSHNSILSTNSTLFQNDSILFVPNIDAGKYTIRVIDAMKQVYTDSFYVNNADAPRPVMVASIYNLLPYQQLKIDASQQMPAGVIYEWAGPGNFHSFNPVVTITESGLYKLTCSQNGCTYLQEVMIKRIQNNVFSNILIYPNPSSGIFNIKINLERIADINMMVYSSDGRMIKSRQMSGMKNYYVTEELRVNGSYELVFISALSKEHVRILIGK